MIRSKHQLARDFLTALSAGELTNDQFTTDRIVWAATFGTSAKAAYQAGVRMLRPMFRRGPRYTVDSLTAEDGRVAAEIQEAGTPVDVGNYHNTYVIMFRGRNGRIAAVAEHFNPTMAAGPAPLMKADMNKGAIMP